MKSVSSIARMLCALIVLAPLVACQNPVSSGAHITPDGFAILDGTTVLVEGTAGRTQPTTSGQLALQLGEQRALQVRFFDAEGTVLALPSGYHLDVATTGDAGIATWHTTQATGTTLPGTLTATGVGTTTFRFRFMHGPVGGGHEETGWNVNVVVTP